MMLVRTENGQVKHVEAVPVIPAVANKRDTQAAYTRIVAALSFAIADQLEADIEIVQRYLWSR